MTSRVCSKCGRTKNVEDFYINGIGVKGQIWYRKECKMCTSVDTVNRTKRNWPKRQIYVKNFNKNHPEYQDRHTWKVKMRALEIVGKSCVYCGETNPIVLTINHKNGGGTKDRVGTDLYRAIINGSRKTDDLETCCGSCQMAYEAKVGRWYKHLREVIEPLLEEYYGRWHNV